MSFKDFLRKNKNGMRKIPRVIHQSWKTHKLPPNIQAAVDSIVRLNPNYEHQIHDDIDCRLFLSREFGPEYAAAWESLASGALRCDFWRYAKIYVEGGVYIDIDFVGLAPLDSLIGDSDTLVTCLDDNTADSLIACPENACPRYCALLNAFFAAEPRHPVLKMCLDKALKNIMTKRDKPEMHYLRLTGPILFCEQLNKYFGRPKKQVFEKKYYGTINLSFGVKPNVPFVFDGKNERVFMTKVSGYSNLPEVTSNHYMEVPSFYRDRLPPPNLTEHQPSQEITADHGTLQKMYVLIAIALIVGVTAMCVFKPKAILRQ